MASSDQVIVLRGGVPVLASVISKLIDLETRGARFQLSAAGRFRVEPVAVLTDADRTFLREHQADARRAIEYAELPPWKH